MPAEPCARDTYTPSPDAAVCPHCAAVVPGCSVPAGALVQALFCLACPRCGRTWNEYRTPGTAERFWIAATPGPT
jgi:hypothetical protein